MRAINSRIRLTPPIAACVAACVLCVAAAAAPQAASPAPAAPAPAARPTARPTVPATTRPATQPASAPAPSPAPARSELGQTPIRRDTARPASTRAAASPSPATVPGFDLPKVAAALALVLTMIFALRWLLRRSMNAAALPGATNAVQVLTRTPVAPRQQVLLLRVGRRMLVVADCNGQLNSLSEISDPDEVAAMVGQLRDEKLTSASRSFGNLLGRWRRATGEGENVDAEDFPRAAPDVPDRRAQDEAADDPADEAADDPSIASARIEINGLVERVRLLSHQFKRT